MSMLFKAKKYVASKFSESGTGQALILKLFGSQGVNVMNGVYRSAARFYGDAQAKQLKIDIFKLILKVVLLYRNRIITEVSAAPARPKMLSMMDMIIDSIEAPPESQSHTPAQLASEMQRCHDAVMPLLQPHVREHNWRRLTRVFDAYGSEPFLKAFLTSPAYEDDRELILVNFQSLVRPYENERSELKAFQKQQAELRRAKIAKMTSPPMSMKLWLDDVHGSVLFQDWLRSLPTPDALNLLLFLRAVDYYRGTMNRALLKSRAVQISDSFLARAAKQPVRFNDESLRQATMDAVAKGSRGAFDGAEADATTQLSAVFLEHFSSSPQFATLTTEVKELELRVTRFQKWSEVGSVSISEDLSKLDLGNVNGSEGASGDPAADSDDDGDGNNV